MVAKTGYLMERLLRNMSLAPSSRPASGPRRGRSAPRPVRRRRATVGGSSTTASPATRPFVAWMPSGVSTPTVIVCFSALPWRTTKISAFVGSVPSRTSAAGGTTSAALAVPTSTAARAKSPPTRSERPCTWTTTPNERERVSTSGWRRAIRPSIAAPAARRSRAGRERRSSPWRSRARAPAPRTRAPSRRRG